ncbi:MAG: PH domain-containing protein [Puniceicoccaceae bacterium]
MSTEERTIRTAEFNERVCTYWLLNGIILCIVTIVGIPFLLIWVPIGLYLTKRFLDRMECILTEKNLKVHKGIFTRVEKTIPLEKITDLGLVQGPIMRYFDVHQLTVETAGQSTGGPLVSLTGIKDVKDFRETVLAQRDSLREAKPAEQPAPAPASTAANDGAVLAEIRDTLNRIEDLLAKRDS